MSNYLPSDEQIQRITEIETTRQRALAGDELAAEEFVLALMPTITGVAGRFGLSKHDREDVAQDVLVKVHRCMLERDENGETPYQASNPFAWVGSVTRNRVFDISRRQRRIEINLTPYDGWDPTPFPGNQTHQPTPEQEAVRNESLARVNALLGETAASESMKQVLVDQTVYGLSYEEIAEKRGLNLGTVRSQIHRAKAYTKQVLLERGFTDPQTAADIFETLRTN